MDRDDAWEWLKRFAQGETLSRRIKVELVQQFDLSGEQRNTTGGKVLRCSADTMSDEEIDSALTNFSRLCKY